MDILKNLEPGGEEKTVDYFIRTKVDDLIERSVSEGKKRRQIETKVSDACSNMATTEGFEYISSISDFSGFPKYKGRGLQENAPDISGSLSIKGEATLVLWFSDVADNEVDSFIETVKADGFEQQGDDYVKQDKTYLYTMSISSSAGRLRIFHKIETVK